MKLLSFNRRVKHGSFIGIKHPKHNLSSPGVEFQQGFYTTLNSRYAYGRGVLKSEQKGLKVVYVNEYDFDDRRARRDRNHNLLKIRTFKADTEWANFLVRCQDPDFSHDYDIIIGPTADDNMINLIEDFRKKYELDATGRYDEGALHTLLKELEDGIDSNQIVFCTRKALKYLKYIRTLEVDL